MTLSSAGSATPNWDATDEDKFVEATIVVRDSKNLFTQEEALELYGLYKQGVYGNSPVDSPSRYRVVEVKKWKEWSKHNSMTSFEAKNQYMSIVNNKMADKLQAQSGDGKESEIYQYLHSEVLNAEAGSILYKARIVDAERYWDAEFEIHSENGRVFEIRKNILISELKVSVNKLLNNEKVVSFDRALLERKRLDSPMLVNKYDSAEDNIDTKFALHHYAGLPAVLAVNQLPESELNEWKLKVGSRYHDQIISETQRAHEIVKDGYSPITDEEFSSLFTTTFLSGYLHSLDRLSESTDKYHKLFCNEIDLAISEDYFICDLTPVRELSPKAGMYIAPSILLFKKVGDHFNHSMIQSIAIENYDHNEVNPSPYKNELDRLTIVNSSSNLLIWELSKLFSMQNATGYRYPLYTHASGHFSKDALVATASAMKARNPDLVNNPIFNLFFNHTYLHLAVNSTVMNSASSTIVYDPRLPYSSFNSDRDSILNYLSHAYRGEKDEPALEGYCYDFKCPDYLGEYGDCIKAYWAVLEAFVTKVVDEFYKEGNAENRIFLSQAKEWLVLLSEPNEGFPNGYIPELCAENVISNPEILINILTSFILHSSVEHAIDHHSGSEHLVKGNSLNVIYRIRKPIPFDKINDVSDMRSVQREFQTLATTDDLVRGHLQTEMFLRNWPVRTYYDLSKDNAAYFKSPTFNHPNKDYLCSIQEEFFDEMQRVSLQYPRFGSLKDLAISIQG